MSHSRTQKYLNLYSNSDAHSYMQSLVFDCQLRGLKQKTIDVYMERIHYLLAYLKHQQISFEDVTKEVIQRYILAIKDQVSPSTVNGRIRTYKRLWGHLCDEELWEKANPMNGIRQLIMLKKVRQVIGPEDVQRMLRSLNKNSFFGYRDLVALLLSWDCMLRSKEIRCMRVTDVSIGNRLIRVSGKGRERMVPLSVRTAKVLSTYLTKWRSKYPGEYVICMTNGGQLSERRYHRLITAIAQNTGVKVSPHGIRHSAATWYIRQPGASIELLRVLLGHSGLNITANYLHLTPEDLVSGYNTLSPGNAIRF